MNKIVEYKAESPLIVTMIHHGANCSMAIPEGGSLGFDLDKVYCKNSNNNWNVCLTEKHTFLKWMDDGILKERFHPEKKFSSTLGKKIAAYKQKAIQGTQPVPSPAV